MNINADTDTNKMNATGPSYIRFFHAAPQAPRVSIFVNGEKIVGNLNYKQFSDYIPAIQGKYGVAVESEEGERNRVIDTILEVPANSVLTVTVVGTPEFVSLQMVPEMFIKESPVPNTDYAYLRVVHFSPNSLPIDLRYSNGGDIFRNIIYQNRSEYKRFEAGTYIFHIAATGNPNVVLTLSDVTLQPGMIYTLYVVGLNKRTPALEGVLTAEGGYV